MSNVGADRPIQHAIPTLDALRFVAAIAVMFYHYCALFRIATPDGSNRPYLAALPAAQYCYLGVELFFLISGFVIFRTAIQKPAQSFLFARVRRLFPAFLLCCTITWCVLQMLGPRTVSVGDYLYNLTMANGLIDPFRSKVPTYVDGVYWTLAIEWKFYLLVWVGIMFRRVNRLELVLCLWLALSSIDAFAPNFWLQTCLIVQWAPYFTAGAIAQRVQRDGWTFRRMALSLVCVGLGALQAKREFGIIIQPAFGYPGSDVTVAVIVVSLFAGFFLLTTPRKPLAVSRARLLAPLGGLSYPIYLLHCGIGGAVLTAFWSPGNSGVLLGALVAGVILCAVFVHEVVEKGIWRILGRPAKHSAQRLSA